MYVPVVLLGVLIAGSSWSGCRAGRQIPGHAGRVLRAVRRRRREPRPSVRSVQHRQTVGPAVRVRVREQRVRNGYEFATVGVEYVVLHEGRLHTRHLGKNSVTDPTCLLKCVKHKKKKIYEDKQMNNK